MAVIPEAAPAPSAEATRWRRFLVPCRSPADQPAWPPGDALFATDTSGLAQDYTLYSGREVLPIGGYLGNVPAPTLATLQADIDRGYVRVFVLPISPAGPDPRVQWIESHCMRAPQPASRRPLPYANFVCAPGSSSPQSSPAAPTPANGLASDPVEAPAPVEEAPALSPPSPASAPAHP